MLDFPSLETRMTEDRLKAQLSAIQSECDAIVQRFDHLGREPTAEEREIRRLDFLASRRRLGELGSKLLELRCSRL